MVDKSRRTLPRRLIGTEGAVSRDDEVSMEWEAYIVPVTTTLFEAASPWLDPVWAIAIKDYAFKAEAASPVAISLQRLSMKEVGCLKIVPATE